VNPRQDDHGPYDELAVGWALHALEPEDEALFGAHLPSCPRCTRTVAETSEVMSALAGDLPQVEPSEGLRDRLRAAVEQTEQLPPPAGVELPADTTAGCRPGPPRPPADVAAPTSPRPPASRPTRRRRPERPSRRRAPRGAGCCPRAGSRRVAAILALRTGTSTSSRPDEARRLAANEQQRSPFDVSCSSRPGSRDDRARLDRDGEAGPVATVVDRRRRCRRHQGCEDTTAYATARTCVGMVTRAAPCASQRSTSSSPQTDVRTRRLARRLDGYATAPRTRSGIEPVVRCRRNDGRGGETGR
jgi:hypothetical protein